MHRRTRQSKSTAQNCIDNSSGDSCSNSDSDNSLELQSASDVINSFLHKSKTVQHVVNTPKSRKATDVINSFLQRKKIVDQASHSQFESALDVINSYLRKDNFAENINDVVSDVAASETEQVTRKRRRTDSSPEGSDSNSQANRNVAKKRRVENGGTVAATEVESVVTKIETIVTTKDEPVDKIRRVPSPGRMVWIPTNETPDNPTSNDNCTANNDSSLHLEATVAENLQHTGNSNADVSASQAEGQQSTSVRITRNSLRVDPSKSNDTNTKDTNKTKPKPKQKASEILKVSFTREVFSRKLKTRRVVEQQTTIRDCPIPKAKYDRALAILNATECRYDETPVDYSLPRPTLGVRRWCNGRRHAEATYDTYKLNTSLPISLTRIVFELDNCLKRENWSQMAELIYFGCGLMKTDTARRAIGTTFFTYALLLLLLDSSPDSISTFYGKRNEILKFLIALGSEPAESEEFLKELHLVMDGSDTANGFLTIKSEEE